MIFDDLMTYGRFILESFIKNSYISLVLHSRPTLILCTFKYLSSQLVFLQLEQKWRRFVYLIYKTTFNFNIFNYSLYQTNLWIIFLWPMKGILLFCSLISIHTKARSASTKKIQNNLVYCELIHPFNGHKNQIPAYLKI